MNELLFFAVAVPLAVVLGTVVGRLKVRSEKRLIAALSDSYDQGYQDACRDNYARATRRATHDAATCKWCQPKKLCTCTPDTQP